MDSLSSTNRDSQTSLFEWTSTEDDAIDLPPIPDTSREQSYNIDFRLPFNKRRRIEDHESNSSDPPMFSSDGPQHSVGAENYALDLKRRKIKYKGTWWGEKPAGAQHQNGKRKFTRNLDSGVWMGSESTDDSLEDELLRDLDGPASKPALPKAFEPRVVYANSVSPAQLEAERIVQGCLEEGKETIDLSGLDLSDLPDSVLLPLKTLTREPPVDAPPASQEEYESLEPRLCMLLANNQLSCLSKELFNLDQITVLSLRGNNLEELPSSVVRLSNLEELNVAYNKLRYLPWEVVRLCREGKLRRLSIQPNPFEIPNDRNFQPVPLETSGEGKPRLVARGSVTLFNKDGSVRRQPNQGVALNLHQPSEKPQTSRVRSLLELAVQECARFPYLSELAPLVQETGLLNIIKLVDLATKVRACGGRICSVCDRYYIIPRTEWVEWWALNASSNTESGRTGDLTSTMKSKAVPVLRRGCCWGCKPDDR